MTIISRYLYKEFAKYFGLILIIVLSIYVVVDFIEKIDDFMEAGLPFSLAAKFFLYNTPFVISQIVPLATLLAVLITFGLMSKNNELIALRAGGVSLLSLVRPVFGFGMISFLAVLFMAEILSPITVSVANAIWTIQVQHRKVAVSTQKDYWLKAPQSIIHLKFYQIKEQKASGLTIYQFDESFHLVKRINAATATFEAGQWRLEQGGEQVFIAGTDKMDVHPFDSRLEKLQFSPDDLAKAVPRTEEMTFIQLNAYIKKVEAEGYEAVRYKVDLHKKIAFPFVCVIMALIGAGLAGRGKIKEGLPISISYGIGIAFLYWIAYSVCVSLGYAGKLPPIIAAWAVNILWLCFATYFIINAE